MRSRICSFFLGVLLLAPLPAGAYFSDTVSTRYADAFASLEQQGVLHGYADGTGRPYYFLNRVEALKVLLSSEPRYAARVAWYQAHLPHLPLFADIDQTAWYAPYIEAGFESGLITGYPDHLFKPAQTVTTDEAIALLVRAYDKKAQAAAGTPWYQPYVQEVADKNLIDGSESMYLGEAVSRGQFFDMIYRMNTIATGKLTAYPLRAGETKHGMLAFRETLFAAVPVSSTKITQFTISIPVLGIQNLIVTHPTDSVTSKGLLAPLQYGVGHLFGYPGMGSKIMIYGHSSGYAWDVSQFTKIFRKVNELQSGDRVYVTYEGKQYVYQVTTQQTIEPHDTTPFSGQGEELILFTCWPPDSIKTRLLIHATPVNDIAYR